MVFKEPPADFNKTMEIVACYVEHGSALLLLHRHAHKSNGDLWGLPGGKIDPGETRREAMLREIREETGLDIPEPDLVYFDTVYVRQLGYDFSYHMFSVAVSERPAIKINPDEHKAFAWASPGEALLMGLVHDQDECTRLFYRMP